MCTLFATKVLNVLLLLAMYPNTMRNNLKEIQNIQYLSGNIHQILAALTFLIMFNIFTDSAAATSSSLVIDVNFSGAAVLHSLLPSYNVYSHFHPQH